MKNIIHTSLFLLLLISLGACNDFLKEASQDEVIPSKAEDLDQLLAYEGYPRRTVALYPYLCMLDDDVQHYLTSNSEQEITSKISYIYLWGGRGNAGNTTMFEDYQNVSLTDATHLNFTTDSYAAFYKLISGCNVVLDMIHEVSGTEMIKKRIKGEALVLRSFYYFNLINLYAYPYNAPNAPNGQSRGIPLKLKSEIEPNSISCSTVAEVYHSILSDVEEGIRLLTEINATGTKFRIGKRAAHLLASRYYLHTENWAKAAEHAGTVIDLNNGPDGLLDMTTVTYPDKMPPYSSEYPYPLSLSNPEVFFLYGSNSENTAVSASYYDSRCLEASAQLLACFDPDDQRLNGYLCEANNTPHRKMSKVNDKTADGFGYNLRLSEALLNRAEAYIQLAIEGDPSGLEQALKDLNGLREKRIKNYASHTWSLETFRNDLGQLLEACREERRREFNFEGMRWFDLRRYGMQSFTHTIDESIASGDEYTLEIGTATPRWVLPILKTHKENNPGLN